MKRKGWFSLARPSQSIDLFNLFLHDCLTRSQCLNVISSWPKATVLNDDPNNTGTFKFTAWSHIMHLKWGKYFLANHRLNKTKNSFKVLMADCSFTALFSYGQGVTVTAQMCRQIHKVQDVRASWAGIKGDDFKMIWSLCPTQKGFHQRNTDSIYTIWQRGDDSIFAGYLYYLYSYI